MSKQENPATEIKGGTPTTKSLKPSIKPRKKFVPKKKTFKTDKPLEHRVRHIRLASLEVAQLVRQTILDYQQELAAKPMDDPDKEFIDQEKVERFFTKLAKKYSACPSRNQGGDLDWIHNHDESSLGSDGSQLESNIKASMERMTLTPDLLNAIMDCERHNIPEPVKSQLGYHIVLVCESRFHTPPSEPVVDTRNVVDDIHGNATQDQGPKQWSSDVAPN